MSATECTLSTVTIVIPSSGCASSGGNCGRRGHNGSLRDGGVGALISAIDGDRIVFVGHSGDGSHIYLVVFGIIEGDAVGVGCRNSD